MQLPPKNTGSAFYIRIDADRFGKSLFPPDRRQSHSHTNHSWFSYSYNRSEKRNTDNNGICRGIIDTLSIAKTYFPRDLKLIAFPIEQLVRKSESVITTHTIISENLI